MKIEFTDFPNGSNWCSGSVNNGEFEFNAKLFDVGSEFGIDEGRVSKLSIIDTSKRRGFNWFDGCIVNYDRGWDIEPETREDIEIFKYVMEFLENAPKRFEDEEE